MEHDPVFKSHLESIMCTAKKNLDTTHGLQIGGHKRNIKACWLKSLGTWEPLHVFFILSISVAHTLYHLSCSLRSLNQISFHLITDRVESGGYGKSLAMCGLPGWLVPINAQRLF